MPLSSNLIVVASISTNLASLLKGDFSFFLASSNTNLAAAVFPFVTLNSQARRFVFRFARNARLMAS